MAGEQGLIAPNNSPQMIRRWVSWEMQKVWNRNLKLEMLEMFNAKQNGFRYCTYCKKRIKEGRFTWRRCPKCDEFYRPRYDLLDALYDFEELHSSEGEDDDLVGVELNPGPKYYMHNAGTFNIGDETHSDLGGPMTFLSNFSDVRIRKVRIHWTVIWQFDETPNNDQRYTSGQLALKNEVTSEWPYSQPIMDNNARKDVPSAECYGITNFSLEIFSGAGGMAMNIFRATLEYDVPNNSILNAVSAASHWYINLAVGASDQEDHDIAVTMELDDGLPLFIPSSLAFPYLPAASAVDFTETEVRVTDTVDVAINSVVGTLPTIIEGLAPGLPPMLVQIDDQPVDVNIVSSTGDLTLKQPVWTTDIPPSSPLFLAQQAGSWKKDLTKEGIEPNPGPLTLKTVVAPQQGPPPMIMDGTEATLLLLASKAKERRIQLVQAGRTDFEDTQSQTIPNAPTKTDEEKIEKVDKANDTDQLKESGKHEDMVTAYHEDDEQLRKIDEMIENAKHHDIRKVVTNSGVPQYLCNIYTILKSTEIDTLAIDEEEENVQDEEAKKGSAKKSSKKEDKKEKPPKTPRQNEAQLGFAAENYCSRKQYDVTKCLTGIQSRVQAGSNKEKNFLRNVIQIVFKPDAAAELIKPLKDAKTIGAMLAYIMLLKAVYKAKGNIDEIVFSVEKIIEGWVREMGEKGPRTLASLCVMKKSLILLAGDVELNPGPPMTDSEGVSVIPDQSGGLEIEISETTKPTIQDTEREIQKQHEIDALRVPSYQKFLNSIERQVLYEMQKDNIPVIGRTRAQIDEALRNWLEPATATEKLITTIANLGTNNKYLGPGYYGGSFERPSSLMELSRRFAMQPTSELDRLARMHDLAYFSKDPSIRKKADLDFIAGADEIPGMRSLMAGTAIKAIPIIEQFIPFTKSLIPSRGGYVKDLTKEGIEPNPGPINIDELVKMIRDYLNDKNKSENRMSPWRRTQISTTAAGNVLEQPAWEQFIIYKGRKMTITINNVPVTVDGPMDGFDLLPTQIKDNANFVVMPDQWFRFVEIPVVGSVGPATQLTAYGNTFATWETKLREVLAALRNQAALLNGPLGYYLYASTLTEDIQGGGLEGVPDSAMLASNGSNAYMLTNLMCYNLMCNCSTAFCPLQNVLLGHVVRPATIPQTIAANNIFGGLRLINGNQNIVPVFGICNASAWLRNYAEGKGFNLGAANQYIPQERVITVFVTVDMFGQPSALWEWILMHLPYPAFTPGITVDEKFSLGQAQPIANPVVAFRALNYWMQSFQVSATNVNALSVPILLVVVETQSALGAANLPQQNYTKTIGYAGIANALQLTNQIGVNNQDPTQPFAALEFQGWADGTVAFVQSANAKIAVNTVAAVSQAGQWWCNMYGSDYDMKTAYVYAAQRLKWYSMAPQAGLAGELVGFNRETPGLWQTYPDPSNAYAGNGLTALQAPSFYGQFHNVYGSQAYNFQGNAATTKDNYITYSVMAPVWRLALAISLRVIREPAKERIVANPMRLYGILSDISDTMALYTSEIMKGNAAHAPACGYGGGGNFASAFIDTQQQLPANIYHDFVGAGNAMVIYTTQERDPTFYAGILSHLSLYMDRALYQTPTYEPPSTDNRRNLDYKDALAITLFPQVSNQVGAPMPYAVKDELLTEERLKQLLLLKPSVSNFAVAPLPTYTAAMLEEATNRADTLFVTIITESAHNWVGQSLSTPNALWAARFAAPHPEYTSTDMPLIVPIGSTYQSEKVKLANRPLLATDLNNHDLPQWVAFSTVKVAAAPFLLPMVNTVSLRLQKVNERLRANRTGSGFPPSETGKAKKGEEEGN